MKNLLFMFIFFNNFNINNIQFEKLKIDDSRIVILAFKPDYFWLFKNASNSKLNNIEISKIEKTLKIIEEKYNIVQRNTFANYRIKNPNSDLKLEHLTIDLSNYKRQYIAIKNEKGEKEVWVNMFCNDHFGKWQSEIIAVKDGGNCYFNLKINLSKNKYYDLSFNGES